MRYTNAPNKHANNRAPLRATLCAARLPHHAATVCHVQLAVQLAVPRAVQRVSRGLLHGKAAVQLEHGAKEQRREVCTSRRKRRSAPECRDRRYFVLGAGGTAL